MSNLVKEKNLYEEQLQEEYNEHHTKEDFLEQMPEAEDKLAAIESLLDDRIVRAIRDMGFEKLSPIQEQAIPYLLEGEDIIGQAQTGTGKTAAFGIPAIQKVDPELRKLQTIILCPTRELAIQAAEELRKERACARDSPPLARARTRTRY